MAFNTGKLTPARAPAPVGVLKTTGATLAGGNGAVAFKRDAKAELFLLAVGRLFGRDSFYESALRGEERLISLTRQIAGEDPIWLLHFTKWLRASGFIRTAAVVIGLEGAKAILDAPETVKASASGLGWPRQLASAGILRADEPGEAAAYWASKYGRAKKNEKGQLTAPHFPMPIKRGLADALRRVANERSALKYDTPSRAFRWADLCRLLHVKPAEFKQSLLFKHLVAQRAGKAFEADPSLKMLHAREELKKSDGPLIEQDAKTLRRAGITHENLSSQGQLDAAGWDKATMNMGYFALLKNLRNMDEAGISDETAARVVKKLTDPEEVGKSRLFPLRFFTAYVNIPSLRWSAALARALDLSLLNVPKLTGRTLVLVDTSGSMNTPWSDAESKEDSVKPMYWDVAALFGLALAVRSEGVDIYSYSNSAMEFKVRKGAETLAELRRWKEGRFNQGGGTNTVGVLEQLFKGHDRVIILTDEQHNYSYGKTVDNVLPAETPVFTFNVAGHEGAQTESKPNRYTFGGLTDKGFQMVDLLNNVALGIWPWETAA